MSHLPGWLWAAPVTLLGLVVGSLGLAFGARATLGFNAIQFLHFPLGRGALTLGHVVLYAGCAPDQCGSFYGSPDALRYGLHEQAHTHQYERLGLLFFPLYFWHGGITGSNPLEQAANAFARGGSFWPAGWWWFGANP